MMKFAALALALTAYYVPVQAEEAATQAEEAATVVAMENIEAAQPQETVPEAVIKEIAAFANVFSTMEQDIPSGGSVAFEGANALTDAFDTSLAERAGGIVFKQSGIYRIQFSLHGGLTPPLPAPTPDWSFALYLSGKHVPGSTCGAFTHTPDERPQFVGGEVTL